MKYFLAIRICSLHIIGLIFLCCGQDVLGGVVSSTLYAYDPQIKYQLNGISDLPPGALVPQLYAFTYDSFHRLRNTVTPLGSQYVAQFDALDRVKQVVENAGTASAETTTYNYDSLGRMFKSENSVSGDTTANFTVFGETRSVVKRRLEVSHSAP